MKQLKDEIKIAAFDVDGTILPNGQNQFSLNTRKIFPLLKLNNIVSVISTAREFATIGDFLEQLDPVDYFIGANGAFIWDNVKKEFIYKSTLNKEDVLKIYEYLKDRINAFAVSDFDKVFKSPSMPLNSWFIKPFISNYYDFDETKLSSDNLYVITINTDTVKETSDLIQKFIDENNLNMEISARWSRGIFIGPKNVSKSHTLSVLCSKLGLEIDKNLIAFGDSSNDFEMLRDARYGVAMERANEKIKSVSDDIALDCEYDGAYLKLKELKLI
ncbi:YcsE-related riboflavin metabolism phosphatase [Mycoplasma nasistruthionis]|uniref:HAD family phosphatase n=1 Tax=Mycoplasma nasistruthionis TaxID=353852 RepID=A0A4Y6I6N0_9MOLU|nr:HAD family hydrolase [Mycoplasma nasistruthionis]QDF65042.1 HAD family phosphatase [Mycoplasma nasistruthionis]